MSSDTTVSTEETRPVERWLPSYGERIFIFSALLLYVAICTHTPISIQLYQSYDDELFIKLGQSLADGRWLGPFNQLTLVKGAGYPIFLAMSSWLGASVTFTQAIFFSTSTLVFALIIYKATGSKIAAASIFLATLFNPNIFQERILRESIYSGQTLAVIALFYLAIHAKESDLRRSRAIVAGLMLGWFWITREEGIWIAPGLGIVLMAKLVSNRSEKQIQRKILMQTVFIFAAFLCVLIVLRCFNFIAYRTFTGVDIKDRNFVAAMQELQRMHVGPEIPYVPVSKETRERVYALSPLFRLLQPTLDPATGLNPSIGSECWIWASACHEFSAGQLFWQIRNGAAAAGKYSSEKSASEYFHDLANQLEVICESRQIPCYSASPIAMMPHLSKVQLASIPSSFATGWSLLLQGSFHGWLDAPPSNGGTDALEKAKHFLNLALSTPVSAQTAASERTITLMGWFLDSGNGWFTLDAPVHSETTLTRLDSPDIAKLFPKADKQRFLIKFKCAGTCILKFDSASGDVFNFNPASPPTPHVDIHYGHSVIAFDSISIPTTHYVPESKAITVSRRAREILYEIYSLAVPILAYLGILASLIAIIFFPREFFTSKALSLALALAALILSRLVILVLINVSSFPSMTPSYFSPVLCLVPAWAILTITGVVGMIAGKRRVTSNRSLRNLRAPLLSSPLNH